MDNSSSLNEVGEIPAYSNSVSNGFPPASLRTGTTGRLEEVIRNNLLCSHFRVELIAVDTK